MDNINGINQTSQMYINTQNIGNTQVGNVSEKNAPELKEDKRASIDEKTSEETLKSVYGNVLDISEDGDTITARPEALAALEDGIVLLKSEDNNVTKVQEEKALEEDAKIEVEKSLVGISDSQIEIMHRRGEISNSTYRKEVDRRERLSQQMNPEDDSKTAQTKRNNAFVQTMSNINSEAVQNEIQNQGYEDAVKNERAGMMIDIFNPAN